MAAEGGRRWNGTPQLRSCWSHPVLYRSKPAGNVHQVADGVLDLGYRLDTNHNAGLPVGVLESTAQKFRWSSLVFRVGHRHRQGTCKPGEP
jgi:hypothetical protein